MGIARMHLMAVAAVLTVVLGSQFKGAYMASIAESAYRRNRVRRKRRALYGAVLAGLISENYALDAELRALNPPLRTVYVRPRWATRILAISSWIASLL